MTCVIKLETNKLFTYHYITAVFLKDNYIYLKQVNTHHKYAISTIKDFALYDYD